LGDLRSSDYENLDLFDVLAIGPKELAISLTKLLMITSLAGVTPKVIAKFTINEGYLHLITPNTFLLESDTSNALHLFKREKGKNWIKFQTLTPNKNEINRKLYVLPPARLEVMRKAKLLPLEVDLELKILVMEFLW
jgi:hypothetical protein